MRLAGDWLAHLGTVAVMQALEGTGGRALFVGGCVRDAVLGRPVGDIDIATDLTPERVVEAVRAAGLKAVPTGIDHGTVTVVAGHRPHEVTTFRRDVETFGRHAVVAFSTEVAEDAARRDFTMNALYADAAGTVIDPLGSGLQDALARHVRFIGHPEDRIREDYLRILRFFRFSAVVGDSELDWMPRDWPPARRWPRGLVSCRARGSAPKCESCWRQATLPPRWRRWCRRVCWRGYCRARSPGSGTSGTPGGGATPRLVAAAGGSWGRGCRGRLRLSRAEVRDLEALRRASGSGESAAVLGWRLGEERGVDAVLVRAAVMGVPIEPNALDEVARGASARFPVAAADLAPLPERPWAHG
jgi:poly(A) polymerase